MVQPGERISVRWSEERIEMLERLGWIQKNDGDVIDDALEIVLDEKGV